MSTATSDTRFAVRSVSDLDFIKSTLWPNRWDEPQKHTGEHDTVCESCYDGSGQQRGDDGLLDLLVGDKAGDDEP